MLGLYPATDANDLTEWQQGNAVPPIEGADFSQWQQELGAHALPYGLQTFPIQQSGFEKDFLLSVGEKNCPYYKTFAEAEFTGVNYNFSHALAETYFDLSQKMVEMDVSNEELCDYLTWAYMNAIPLKGTDEDLQTYNTLATSFCPENYYNQMTMATLRANDESGSLLTSEFLQNIKSKVEMALKRGESEEENVSYLPLSYANYQALTSNNLLAIANQTLWGVNTEQALPDSSTLIFEVNHDGTIQGYLNDQEYTPKGCSASGPCDATVFLDAIMKFVAFPDVETACNNETTLQEGFAIQN